MSNKGFILEDPLRIRAVVCSGGLSENPTTLAFNLALIVEHSLLGAY